MNEQATMANKRSDLIKRKNQLTSEIQTIKQFLRERRERHVWLAKNVRADALAAEIRSIDSELAELKENQRGHADSLRQRLEGERDKRCELIGRIIDVQGYAERESISAHNSKDVQQAHQRMAEKLLQVLEAGHA